VGGEGWIVAPEPATELLEHLAAVARTVDTGSVDETLQRIVETAVEVVPACEHAGVTIKHARRITTPAASDAVALRLDDLQVETGEGPCIDAIAGDDVLRTDDLAAERRWPRFSAAAATETGIASALALRLFARGKTLGALNLFSTRRAAFGDEDVAIAVLFAALASVALVAAGSEEGLQVAIRNRDVIGRAKGILMERHELTDEEAFRRLAEVSQRMNIRVVEIAERIAGTGEGGDAAPC
jgi:GAF domain-containing protein